MAAAVDELSDYLIGKDPRNIEDIWTVLYRGGFYRGGAIHMSALAGIDQALWDIKGKALGVSVSDLLGGQVRDKIRVYSWIGGDRPADTARAAKEAVGRGFTAVKMNGTEELQFLDTFEKVDLALANVAAVRDAVGPNVGIGVDFHGRVHRPMAKVLVRRESRNVLVSYDPNVRPSLMGTPEQVVPRVEELVALSDVVKASDEDLEWLYPDTPVEDVMRRWLKLGPSVMVTTRGPWGAYAMIRHSRNMRVVDPVNVSVSDTVGAGDSFMAGLISGLVHAGLLGSTGARERLLDADWSDIQPALHRAVMTSAITVSKDGAYGPTMDEIRSVQAIDPTLAD